MTQSLMFRRLESFGPIFFKMSAVSIDQVTVFIEVIESLGPVIPMACIFVRSGFPLLEVSNLQKITGWPLWPSGRVQRRTLTKDLQVAFPPHLYLR